MHIIIERDFRRNLFLRLFRRQFKKLPFLEMKNELFGWLLWAHHHDHSLAFQLGHLIHFSYVL